MHYDSKDLKTTSLLLHILDSLQFIINLSVRGGLQLTLIQYQGREKELSLCCFLIRLIVGAITVHGNLQMIYFEAVWTRKKKNLYNILQSSRLQCFGLNLECLNDVPLMSILNFIKSSGWFRKTTI